MAAVLVYQGGGGLDFGYSLVVAILFYTAVEMSRYIAFGKANDNVPLKKLPLKQHQKLPKKKLLKLKNTTITIK